MTSNSEIAHWIVSIRELLRPRSGALALSGAHYTELRASITRTLTVDDIPVRYVPAMQIEKLALDAAAWKRRFPCHEHNGHSVYVVRGEVPATILENLLIEFEHSQSAPGYAPNAAP